LLSDNWAAEGDGLDEAGARESDGLGATDPDDAGDPDGVGVADRVDERDGVGERLGRGLREGRGDGDGVYADAVGLGVVTGVTTVWAAGAGTGRTRMYSASTARNRPLSTMVEIRGRLPSRCLMRRLPSRGRYRGRPRR
jgi:hypothetical protein